MLHVVEVDQSGRIEFTQVDTVLAFSNGISFSICIPSTVKQHAVQQLRLRYRKLRQPYLKMFTIGLFLLLKRHVHKLDTVIIDTEYYGHDGEIRGMLLNYLRIQVPSLPKESIMFKQIGKKSTAHIRAYNTYTGIHAPDYTVSEEEYLRLLSQ